MKRPPRVLFFGMQGRFSWPILHAILEHGIDVCAVVLPASTDSSPHVPAIYRREQLRAARPLIRVLNSALQSDLLQLAWERRLPVWEVTHLSDALTVATLAAYQPDCICVACFSQRIPRSILEIPLHGCLNVHPSLLPANRGPVPLFWVFRQGLKQTGVTIHFMDEGMDTGDLLAQEVIEVPDGISYVQLEEQCAVRGGELLARTVYDLYAGRATRVPQDESKSSYQPFPGEEDYL